MVTDMATRAAPARDQTLRALKAILSGLEGGPSLYDFMVGIPDSDPEWGTKPGKQYSLGVDDDGTYRSVLSWKVISDGSVDLVKVGRSGSP